MVWVTYELEQEPNLPNGVQNLDDYTEFLKYNEGRKVNKSGIHKAYKSYEGGEKTVGYGHKLHSTKHEKYKKLGLSKASIEEYGLTEEQATNLLKLDIMEHYKIARQKFINDKYGTKEDFNALSASKQFLLTDLQYNGAFEGKRDYDDASGNNTTKGSLVENIVRGNWSQIKIDSENSWGVKSYKRTSKGDALTRRNDTTLKYFITPNESSEINDTMNEVKF